MKRIVVLTLLALGMFQCVKRTSDILGPDACPSETFAVIVPLDFRDHVTLSTTNLNLMNNSAEINAAFSEIISYKFTITGLSSGAVFVLEGKGNTLSYHWHGNSTNGKYFTQGEQLAYTLSNICKNEPLGSGQIRLTTIVGYNGFGLKIVNFEEMPPVASNVSVNIIATTMNSSSPGYQASPQGGNYRNYVGSKEVPGWWYGNEEFTGINYSSLGNNPSEVYLNFFAKGKPNSQCYIAIYETVQGSALKRQFAANVSEQWKLYSVKLSEIGILNPSQISRMSIEIQNATSESNSAEVDLDMIIFTFDKPF